MTHPRNKGNRRIAVKARAVLAYAESRARQAADWVELHNALFGIGGKATAMFPTEAERTAFCRQVARLREWSKQSPTASHRACCVAGRS